MKKNMLAFIVLSLMCIMAYGCGSEDIEDSTAPALESSVLDFDIESPNETTTATKSKKESKTTETTTVTTKKNTTSAKISSASAKVTATTIAKGGETQFQKITGLSANYESKVPSVLTPHEPVIYTTESVATSTSTETTVSTSETTTNTMVETGETTSTDITTVPPAVSIDEIYFNDVKVGENAQPMIDSFGEPLSLETSPSDLYINDIQGEERHYCFENLEIFTCFFEDNNILREVIIRDSAYVTMRGLSVGMTLVDAEMLYGVDYVCDENNIYRYIVESDTGEEQFYIHIENDVIDYIGYKKLLQ